MDTRSFLRRWWRLAGLVTWVAVGGTFVADFVEAPGQLHEARTALWAAAFFFYPVAFWVSTAGDARPRSRALRLACAGAQALAALAIAWLPQKAVGFIFLVLVAGELAHLLRPVPASLWILAQSVAMAWVYLGFLPLQLAAAYIGVYLGFQAFAYLTVRAADNEARMRADLALVNADLRATQALLADSSRMAERVRIARDLHDVLGHDLTALCLRLEVARHLTEGPALVQVEEARAVAQRLLADVREVVSDLRGAGALDLGAALRALAGGLPSPRVHVIVGEGVRVEDPARAEALLRCAQEAVTNAIRHAGAANVWLELRRTEAAVELEARDDGRGAAGLKEGNGLRGMRERLRALGGRLSVEAAPGAGLSLRAALPLPEAGAA